MNSTLVRVLKKIADEYWVLSTPTGPILVTPLFISLHFDYLPSDVLSFSGYDFFQFIKNTLGEPESQLLCKIAVKTTSSFLLLDDPLDIFNQDIDDQELDRLKEELCFRMKNDKFLIKPGVLSGFHSLKEALKNKLHEETIHQKNKNRRSSNCLSTFLLSPLSSCQLQQYRISARHL